MYALPNQINLKAIYQVGNLVSFEFVARLEDSLGSLTNIDLVDGYCGKLIFEKTKLNCAKSLFSMFDEFFLEREEQKNLFLETQNFLEKISNNEVSDDEIIANYIRLELSILESLGYAIDLSCCVVTSSNVNLAFVSPKSGRAVSMEAGKPYENKLLKLPDFLTEESSNVSRENLIDGLKLSGFFLEKFLNSEDRKFQFEGRNNLLKNL